MWHLCESLTVLFKQRSSYIENFNNDKLWDVPSNDSRQQVGGGGLPGDDAGAGADGRPPNPGDHHPLLHHGPRHGDPRQHLCLSRHLQKLPPPHRYELLPRVLGLCGPHDHHSRWEFTPLYFAENERNTTPKVTSLFTQSTKNALNPFSNTPIETPGVAFVFCFLFLNHRGQK